MDLFCCNHTWYGKYDIVSCSTSIKVAVVVGCVTILPVNIAVLVLSKVLHSKEYPQMMSLALSNHRRC